MSKEELNMISCALAYRKNQNDSDIAKMEKALECGSESGDLSIQSEKHILQGCIRLLCEAGDSFRNTLNSLELNLMRKLRLESRCSTAYCEAPFPVEYISQRRHFHKSKVPGAGRELDDEVEIIENEDDDQ